MDRSSEVDAAREANERRLYYISDALFVVALYGIPVALVGGVLSGLVRLNPYLELTLCFGAWAVIGATLAGRMKRRYLKTLVQRHPNESPTEGVGEHRKRLLFYTGLSSFLLLAFTGVQTLTFLPAGLWGSGQSGVAFVGISNVSGVAFFSCALLFALTTLYTLLGRIQKIKAAFYPEYPELTAVLFFMLGMVAFVIFYALAR